MTQSLSKLTSDLVTLNGSDPRCMGGQGPGVTGINPRNIVQYRHVLDGIKNKVKVPMTTTTKARRNARCVIVELALQDLERCI